MLSASASPAFAAQKSRDTTTVVTGTGDTAQDTHTDIPIAGNEGDKGERDG